MNPTFALNQLPAFDPAKETKLVRFLEKPIDSREIESPSPSHILPPMLKKNTTSRKETEEQLSKEWEERFSHIYKQVKPHSHCQPHQQFVYPSLAKRQPKPNLNPYNRQSVEEIVDMRNRSMQGPAYQPQDSHLPMKRYLPNDLIGKPSFKRRRLV